MPASVASVGDSGLRESNRTLDLSNNDNKIDSNRMHTPKCVYKSNIVHSHVQKWNACITCSYGDTAAWCMGPIKR